ncbi:MAG: TrkH family potassium uptake protein [Thermoguttaceae bacterium]
MNYALVFRHLGSVAFILGMSMACSLVWASPALGGVASQERWGVFGLLASMAVCCVVGFTLRFLGRSAVKVNDSDKEQRLFRREAMAVVVMSWLLATVLGGLPYILAGVERSEGVRFSFVDAMFESQSGFSTTGATVFAELENRNLLPRCVLFWRSTTHFLGGLGIMVLFVVLLGQGTAGKAFMKLEMSGKGTGGSPTPLSSQMAKLVTGVYCTITAISIVVLCLLGLSVYDSICHTFGAIATGGFSTYNASAGYFSAHQNLYPHAALIEWFLVVVMFLGGCNFFLIFQTVRIRVSSFLRNQEFLAYAGVIVVATLIVLASCLAAGDFDAYGMSDSPHIAIVETERIEGGESLPQPRPTLEHSLRISCFQVVSILTTTGYCTDEFEKWNPIALGTIFLLMAIGGCAGGTGGGWKVVRFVVLTKLCGQEIERSFRPNVVRPLLLDGEKLERDVQYNILIFFAFAVLIVVLATFTILVIEPQTTWHDPLNNEAKLIDTAGMVMTTFNNVGPAFGIVGARQNYGGLTEITKLLLAFLMLLGRLEIMAVLALFHPTFWRN